MERKGFDDWAESYDVSVRDSDKREEFPFICYCEVMEQLREKMALWQPSLVLDVGIGTGEVEKNLPESVRQVTGMDFSQKMLDITAERYPQAKLICHDIKDGWPSAYQEDCFDLIVSAYTLHHLDWQEKIKWIEECRKHLTEGGHILIADIGFPTVTERQRAQEIFGAQWDEEEFYFAGDEWKESFPDGDFSQIGPCAAVMTLQKSGCHDARK